MMRTLQSVLRAGLSGLMAVTLAAGGYGLLRDAREAFQAVKAGEMPELSPLPPSPLQPGPEPLEPVPAWLTPPARSTPPAPTFVFEKLSTEWDCGQPAIALFFNYAPAARIPSATPADADAELAESRPPPSDAKEEGGTLPPEAPAQSPAPAKAKFTHNGWIAVSPEVPFKVDRSNKRLRLTGAFKPGQKYEVTLRQGLPDTMGRRLPRELTRMAWIPDARPDLSVEGGRLVFRADGQLKLNVTVRNLRRIAVSSERLQEQNLVEYALRGGYSWNRPLPDGLGDELAGASFPVATPANEYAVFPLDLRAALAGTASGDDASAPPVGIYGLLLQGHAHDQGGRCEGCYRFREQQLLVVSDLGLSVRSWPGGALAWAVKLSDGKPAAGAEVKIYTDRRRLLAAAVTDADGLARLSWTGLDAGDGRAARVGRASAEVPALAVVARSAAAADSSGSSEVVDRNYVLLDGDERPRTADWRRGRPYLRRGYEVFAATERGVYRAGDTVSVSALARGVADAVPADVPFVVRLRRPDGKVGDVATLRTDPNGRMTYPLALSPDSRSGVYRVEFALPGGREALGGESFRVADYMPRTVRLEVSAAEAPAAGEIVAVALRGSHLFGEPARELRGSVAARWTSVRPSWPSWSGWTFGVGEKDGDNPETVNKAYRLDRDGKAEVAIPPPSSAAARRWRLTVEAMLFDIGGRPVEETVTRTVFAAPAAVGIRFPGTDPVAGRDAKVELVRVGPDGAPASDPAASGGWKAVLVRFDYVNMLRRNAAGLLAYQWTREEVVEATNEGVWRDGRAEAALRPARSGEYGLRVTDRDGAIAAERRFFVHGVSGAVQWAIADPEAVELVPDREAYPVGAAAKVTVRAPFAGTALATVETDRVLAARRVELHEGENVLEWTVAPEWTPNAFLSVTLVRPTRPEKEWTPRRAGGLVRLNVDVAARKLDVAVDAPDLRPGTSVPARIAVRRADGVPVAGAAVVVAAVDEGVLALTRFKSPSPWDFFLGPRRGGVGESDLFGRIAPELAAWETVPTPGGDRSGEFSRLLNPIDARRVRTAALFVGDATTGPDGVAAVKLDIPEYVGELRLMAWAASGGDYGAGVAAKPVRSDILFRASHPRFAAPGDVWTVPVRLFNLSRTAGSARLRVTLDGPVALADPAGDGMTALAAAPGGGGEGFRGESAPVALAAGAEAGLSLRLRAAPAVGKATVRLEAEMNGMRYGETVELPVRPAAAFARASGSVDVPPGAAAPVVVGGDWLPGTARATVWVGGGDYAALAGLLQTLLAYPHGCAEQTSARMMGLAALPDLAAALRPGMAGKAELQRFLDVGSARLSACFGPDGRRLRMWPYYGPDNLDNDAAEVWGGDAWIGLFALDTLLSARAAGFTVDASLMDRLLRSAERQMETVLNKLPDPDHPSPQPPPDPLRRRNGGSDGYQRVSPVPSAEALDRLWAGPAVRAAYACRLLAASGRTPGEALVRLLGRDDRRKALGLPRNASEAAFLADAAGFAGDAEEARKRLDPAPAVGALPVDGFDSSPRETAIVLRALSRWRPDAAEADALAARLLERVEATPWGWSTQESAFGLAALAARVRARPPVPDATVTVTTPRGTETCNARSGRSFSGLAPGETVAVAHDGTAPVPVRWWVEGVPADGKTTEADRIFHIRRRIYPAGKEGAGEGAALSPPFRLTQGSIYVVELEMAGGGGEAVVAADLLPAGLEGENAPRRPGPEGVDNNDGAGLWVRETELRDDRMLLFGTLRSGRYRYTVRAVTVGEFDWPAADLSAMYAPNLSSVHGRTRVTVVPADAAAAPAEE